MSNTMGIASAFVLSALFLSPVAMAEESPSFVAQNAARAKAFQASQASQAVMTAKAQDAAQTPQASTSAAKPSVEKDS